MQIQLIQTIIYSVLRTEFYYREIWYLYSGAQSSDNPAVVPKCLLFHLKPALPPCIYSDYHLLMDIINSFIPLIKERGSNRLWPVLSSRN